MLKLIKYLKPFLFSLLIAIGLLYVQAQTDLALPDYMSEIVNVGIQNSGIKNATPDIITKSSMDQVLLFLSESEKNEVLSNYDLVTSTDSKYDKFEKDYKKLDNQDIYIIKNLSEKDRDQLDSIYAKGAVSVLGMEQLMNQYQGKEIPFGEQMLPVGTNLFSVIQTMPEEARLGITEKVTSQFADMGESMVIQAGTQHTKNVYKSLGANVGDIQRNFILKIGGIMLLITLLGAVASILVGFISARIAAGLGKNLRKQVFTKVSNFSNVEFDQFSTASLITRSTNDITQIQTLMVIMIRMVFYAPIIGVGGVIRAMDKNSSMSWIIAVAVGILLLLIVGIFVVALPRFKRIQKLVDKLNMVTRENLSGLLVIRAFNTQKFEENRFDGVNKDLTNTNLFVNRVMSTLFPIMMLIMNGVTLVIVWVGAHQIADANMQVGDMIAFMQYAMQIIMAFLMLSMMFILIPRASVSALRISEVLETEPTIIDPQQGKDMKQAKGNIQFNHVSFKYPGAEEDMLHDVSFTAEPGKVTAIIGSTGSGKSTLINLIPRFYDVTEGEVLIDGINVKDMTQKQVRDLIGYVPQKSSLFSGTIESNLKFGDKNTSEENLIESAEIAQAMEFISQKEEGFKTEISQGGKNVSGGQKQRLSIARALVKRPKIYIFDDSFSALDFKTDQKLRKALLEKTGESTVLIVAQRISTIKNADQIIVLEDGNMVGIGTHKELMSTCETYQEIALSQLSKEELS